MSEQDTTHVKHAPYTRQATTYPKPLSVSPFPAPMATDEKEREGGEEKMKLQWERVSQGNHSSSLPIRIERHRGERKTRGERGEHSNRVIGRH